MVRMIAAALALLASITALEAQPRPPSQRTGPITIYGEGSTGPISDMSVQEPGAGSVAVALKNKFLYQPSTAADWGIKCDGVWDDAPKIRAALSAMRFRINAALQLPNATCAIASTISTGDWSNVKLLGVAGSTGAGSGTNAQDGTVLKWIGPGNGVMIDWQSPNATRPYLTSSSEIAGIMLDGNGLAGKGVYQRGLYDGKLKVKVRNVTQIAVDLDIYQGGGADVQFSDIGPINIDLNYPASVNADGFVIGAGSSYNNVHHSLFKQINVIHQAGTGIKIGNADSNTFIGLQAQYPVDGSGVRTGKGVDLIAGPATGPGGVTQAARDNVFVNVSTPSGIFARAGTAGNPTYGNMMYGVIKGSGEPEPVIEPGAALTYNTSFGDYVQTKTYTRQQFWQSLGDFMVMMRNQAGATIGYMGADGIFSTGTPVGSFRIRGDLGVALGAGNSPAIAIDGANNVTFPGLKSSPNDGDAAAQGVALGAIYYNSTINAIKPRL